MSDSQLQQLLEAIKTLQDLGKVAYFNKGAYNSETTYEINDVITYQGSSYVSLDNNNQGNLPTNTTYWSIVALKGDKGDTGKPFVIEKTYSSVEDMVADYDNMNINDYVMISGNIEEEQNATLWTKTETPAPTYKWVYLADFSGASGITGQTPNIQIGNVTEGNEPAVTRRQGSSNENPILDFVLKTGATGATGATGNGISSISKTSTSGLTDTYTIAYTNGNNTTFDVTNGKGISSIAKTGTSGLVDTYTITYNDGTTSTFTITNGEDGEVTQAQLDEVQAELDRYKTLANVLPKATGEGTEVTLNNCGASLLKMQPKGNTEQDSYTGYNFLKNEKTTTTKNGITFTMNEDGSIDITGTATANAELFILGSWGVRNNDYIEHTTYSFYSVNDLPSGLSVNLAFFNNGSNNYNKGISSNSRKQTFNISDLTYDGISCAISVTNGATINYKLKLMLVKGDTELSYEPYTGSTETTLVPSPNPDFPQDVRVATGNNTIKQTGKNLVNISDVYSITPDSGITVSNDVKTGKVILNGIANQNTFITYSTKTFNINDVVSLSANNSVINSNVAIRLYKKSNANTSSNISLDTINKTSNNLTLANDYDAFQIRIASGTTLNNFELYPQLEENSTASDFVPYYTPQTYSLNLGNIELCKIGDYQDYIYKENGKWYKHSEIGKVVLDGSETYSSYSNSRFRTPITNKAIDGFTTIISMCNMLIATTQSNMASTTQNNLIAVNGDYIWIRITSSTTMEQLQTLFSSNNAVVYFILNAPTNTEITDNTLISQLNALNDTLSFDGQNNISSEYASGNAPVIISAEAIAKFSS